MSIFLNGWILPIGGASSGRVCSCSLRSRLVFDWFRNLLFFQISHSAHLDKMLLHGNDLLDHLILNCMELWTSFKSYMEVSRMCSFHGGHTHWQISTHWYSCAGNGKSVDNIWGEVNKQVFRHINTLTKGRGWVKIVFCQQNVTHRGNNLLKLPCFFSLNRPLWADSVTESPYKNI